MQAAQPTIDELNAFYEQIISEARELLPGLQETQSPSPTPLQRFTNQQFLLWDYLTNVDNDDLPQHFANLTTLCKRRKISRAIIFIKDPAFNNFFQPDNNADDAFIALANNLVSEMRSSSGGNVPNFELAVFFESGNFTSNATPATAPTHNPLPSTELSGYFSDLKNMLDWANEMVGKISGITEITFDPEASGANKSIQQLVYNYADEYKWINSLEQNGTPVRLGTTLGVDESKETYANLSEFPVSSIYTSQISTFPSPPFAYNRGDDPNAPLLQSVYIQVYQTSIPALFLAGFNSTTGKHNGQLAGTIFNKLLRDQPYLPTQEIAVPGKITFTKHSTAVTGSSTADFTNFADPLLYAFDQEIGRVNKIGVVSSVESSTSLTLSSPGAAFSSPAGGISYQRTEVATAWDTQINVTQDLINNIYWMLSLNYSPSSTPSENFAFFGNWLLRDFMDFIDSANAANNQSGTTVFSNFQFPTNNYVIYNYQFTTTTVQTEPKFNGETFPWNLSSN